MPTGETTYQLKVTLNGIRPPVWRRLLVPGSLSLTHLHDVLQVAMGWTDSHLHQFVAKGVVYALPEPDFGTEARNEARVRIDEVLRDKKDAMVYEYDFGDGWEHSIVLEKLLPTETGAPSCIAGARACPPEDCGCICGYKNLLEITRDPKHPEHEEMLDWLGGAYDAEHFDTTQVNAALSRMKLRGLPRSSATARKRPAP